MSNIPYYYAYENVIDSSFVPSEVHTRDNITSRYFNNYLFQRAISVFDFQIPEYWNKEYFLYVLFWNGYLGVIKGQQYGDWIPQMVSLYGHDIYYQPTNLIVTNPYAPELSNTDYDKYKIGRNCEIIKIQPNFHSIADIIGLYADMLALSLEGISMNLINSKLAYIFGTDKKSVAESFKKMFDMIQSGTPAVVVSKELFNKETGDLNVTMFQQNPDVYNMSDRLADFRKVLNMFDTEIGIPSVNYEKKERMLVDEINANNVETESLSDIWLETLQDSIEKVNALTGLQLQVSKRYGGEANVY